MVQNILTNEKYRGDALLQKKFTVNFLTKKQKVNEGEIPQYYVENAHPAIIEPDVFDMEQVGIARRKNGESRHCGTSIFAGKIKCGCCGGFFGAKVWHSTSKYKRTIYQCNSKFKNTEKCGTPHFDEESIKRLFVLAVNKLIVNKDEIIANFKMIKTELFDTAALEKEQAELQREKAVVTELMQKCINENARNPLNQDDYNKRFNPLAERYNALRTRFNEVSEQIADKQLRRDLVEGFIAEIAKQEDMITEFDERLWCSLLDFATARADG